MATGGDDATFVDTNVLVYAGLASAPRHRESVQTLRWLHEARAQTWISRQVLREYLAVLSRPQTFASPVPMGLLVADIRDFATRFQIAEDGPSVTDRLLALLQAIPTAGKQVHDANIVATMLAHGIPRLVTANPGEFERFGHLITIQSVDATA